MLKYVEFYLFLRDVYQAKYDKREEYRRNVAMLAELETGIVEVSIDVLGEYEEKMKGFVEHIEQILGLAEERL